VGENKFSAQSGETDTS